MDRARWIDLLSPTADRDQALEFFDAMVPQGITRVVVKERDRSALQGTLPGEGYRLVVEVFIETGPRGRIATWRLDIRRPRGDDIGRQPWRILAEDRLASIEGLHRLSLHPEKQFAAKNLVLKSIDFELRLPAGDVFVAETPEGVTAIVLLGDGTMVFQPAPKEETRPAEAVRRRRGARDAVHHRVRAASTPSNSSSACRTAMLEPVTLDSRDVPPRPGRVRRGRAEVVQSRPERPEPRRLVAAAAAGRLRRRGEDAPLRRPDLRAIERRGRRRHAVPAGAQAQHLRPTRRSRSCRAAAASSTKTTTSTTTCSTTTSTRRSFPSASGWKAGRG